MNRFGQFFAILSSFCLRAGKGQNTSPLWMECCAVDLLQMAIVQAILRIDGLSPRLQKLLPFWLPAPFSPSPIDVAAANFSPIN